MKITIHPSITYERVFDAIERREVDLDNPGFCLSCVEKYPEHKAYFEGTERIIREFESVLSRSK